MFFKILLHSYYIYGIYTYIRMVKVIKDVHVIYGKLKILHFLSYLFLCYLLSF